MKETAYAEPSKSELEILQVLWDNGPLSVRVVNDKLNETVREVQYPSTLKTMQIMAGKAFLNRDESQVQHIYSAAIDEAKTKKLILHRFVDTMYQGSASNLVMQLLGSKKTTKREIEQVLELLKKTGKK